MREEIEKLKSSQSPTVDLSDIEQQLAKFNEELEQLQSSQTSTANLSSIEQQLAKFSEELEQLKGSQTSIPQSTLDDLIARLDALEKQSEKINPPTKGTHEGHEWVDLGLSVMWATCNIGAEKPEDYGNYYAWGELEGCDKNGIPTDPNNPKTVFNWTTYEDSKNKAGAPFNEYNSTGMELKDEHDVAYIKWGGTWHIPTLAQLNELKTQCFWQFTTTYNEQSVVGFIVYKAKSNADKGSTSTAVSLYNISDDPHIFLPAASCRYDDFFDNGNAYSGVYWTRSIGRSSVRNAYRLTFNGSVSILLGSVYTDDGSTRYVGASIRAVCQHIAE